MGPGRSRTEATLCTIIACILAILALPAAGQMPVAIGTGGGAPDTEQFFGVGARADAMGDAFVAIANDPTAAFWNPAGLSFLQPTEMMAVVKSLPSVTQTTNIGTIDGGVFPGFETTTTTESNSVGSSNSESTFVGITTRIGDPTRCGTLSISRTLAGFLNRDWTTVQQFMPVDPGDVDTLISRIHDEMRVDYNSITYGWKSSERLSAGVGIVQAVAKTYSAGTVEETYLDGPESFVTDIEPAEVSGKGYGGIVGALYTPKILGAGQLTLGASYLSKIVFSGLDASNFGTERPDRVLLGANYRQPVSGTENEVQWSLQLSRNGQANISSGGDFVRNSIWNFYFGGEYDIHHGNLSCPIRYGLFTNRTPNANVYGSETWLTAGLGASHSKQDWKAEVAFQRGTRTGISLLSFSGGYSF